MKFEQFLPLLQSGIITVHTKPKPTLQCYINAISFSCNQCPYQFHPNRCYEFRHKHFKLLYYSSEFRTAYPELLL